MEEEAYVDLEERRRQIIDKRKEYDNRNRVNPEKANKRRRADDRTDESKVGAALASASCCSNYCIRCDA